MAARKAAISCAEHTTPSSVADLNMSLAAPVRGVVIDPACGYGTLLLAASKAATTQLTLIGKDVSSDACHITRLRMFVHGLTADVTLGDTLQARTLFDDATLMDAIEADLIMAVDGYPALSDLTSDALRRIS